MKFSKAIVRKPSERFSQGLTTAKLGKPDWHLALEQHQNYIEALEKCGLEVMILEEDDRYPDSVFVEDAAILTSKFGMITRPGAVTRRGEVLEMDGVLHRWYMAIHQIQSPGTLDGGDIMQVENKFYIGLSERTNAEGSSQFQKILKSYGFEVIEVQVKEALHLKSSVAYLDENTLVLTSEFSKFEIFNDYGKIVVPDKEKYAANCLYLNGRVLVAEGFPGTRKAIEKAGYETLVLDVSEFRKLDGGLSCLSLRV